MAKKQEYTCESYIRGADGTLTEFATLTQEKQQEIRERIAETVGKVVGEYLTQHPDEIEPFCKCQDVKIVNRSPAGASRS